MKLMGDTGKPADCECSWPYVRYRNMSGHAEGCPCHRRHLEAMERKRQEALAAKLPKPAGFIGGAGI